jgi:hypothetical protein
MENFIHDTHIVAQLMDIAIQFNFLFPHVTAAN